MIALIRVNHVPTHAGKAGINAPALFFIQPVQTSHVFLSTLAKVTDITVITNTGCADTRSPGRYIIGKWWDWKGENEIDLIVVDPITKEAWIYKLKKQDRRYKEDEFRVKVENVLGQVPELRKLTIHIGSLSIEDM